MHYFCTLFDFNYLLRGLAMYESLRSQCKNFHLYIFAFDQNAFEILSGLKLNNVTVISLDEFEDERLLQIKPSRSKVEYYWTCTSSTILFCLKNYNLEQVTYIDSDIFFYSSPVPLLEEMENSSILITEHKYTPIYDQTKRSGKYCVQFMSFRNNDEGMNALQWWRNACIDWCYAKVVQNKFGDQKYLDDWKKRFSGVHVCDNLGCGIAPWNIQQYKIEETKDNGLILTETRTNDSAKLVFYHFHGIRILSDVRIELSAYKIEDDIIRLLYIPYLLKLKSIETNISTRYPSVDFTVKKSDNLMKEIIIRIKRILRLRVYKIYNLKELNGTLN